VNHNSGTINDLYIDSELISSSLSSGFSTDFYEVAQDTITISGNIVENIPIGTINHKLLATFWFKGPGVHYWTIEVTKDGKLLSYEIPDPTRDSF
jgi:hypothetical protein